jgi:hypothetical protein
MGAKTDVSSVSTLTPEQKVLLDSMMRGVTDQMQGFQFGEGWGGPSNESYGNGSGYGGKVWSPGGAGQPWSRGGANGPGMTTRAISAAAPPQQGMAPVPAANPVQASNPNNLNPFGMAAYSNREQLVSPIVNPFRRNIGG